MAYYVTVLYYTLHSEGKDFFISANSQLTL